MDIFEVHYNNKITCDHFRFECFDDLKIVGDFDFKTINLEATIR